MVNGVLDGPGRRQGVDPHGRRTVDAERRPPLPLRAEGVDAQQLHERGEGLVQPDAVPPLHRDEVAEPHVRELVGDDVGDVLQLGLRRGRSVDEHQHLPTEPLLRRCRLGRRTRRLVGAHLRVFDEIEVRDRLRLPVFEHLEIGGGEPRHQRAALVGDRHPHIHQVDGGLVGRVYLPRIVTAAQQLADLIVGEMVHQLQQFGISPEKMFSGVTARLNGIFLVIAIDGFFHPFQQ